MVDIHIHISTHKVILPTRELIISIHQDNSSKLVTSISSCTNTRPVIANSAITNKMVSNMASSQSNNLKSKQTTSLNTSIAITTASKPLSAQVISANNILSKELSTMVRANTVNQAVYKQIKDYLIHTENDITNMDIVFSK